MNNLDGPATFWNQRAAYKCLGYLGTLFLFDCIKLRQLPLDEILGRLPTVVAKVVNIKLWSLALRSHTLFYDVNGSIRHKQSTY